MADDVDDDTSAPAAESQSSVLNKLIACKNELEILDLPVPTWDELGSPVWVVTELEIKAACKRRLLLAHPDKNQAHQELAARAFEIVNKAVKTITDLDTRDTVLQQYVAKARQEAKQNFVYEHPQEHLEADLDNLVKEKRIKEDLTNKHFGIYKQKIQDKIAARTKRRQEEIERKKALDELASSSEDDAPAKVKKSKGRKQFRGVF